MSEFQNTGKIEKRLDGTTWYDQDYVDNLQQESKQLNSILAELEEWVDNEIKSYNENIDFCKKHNTPGLEDYEREKICFRDFKNEISELKEKYK